MSKTINIDIESYSSVDLTECGVWPYVEAPDFEILLIGYKVEDEPTRVIDLAGGEEVPEAFKDALYSGDYLLCAHNANFEKICLSRYFGKPIPPEHWSCTMVLAANLGLPGSLDKVGAALGLDKQKMTEGKELIQYFCKPCRPTKANGGRTRNRPDDAPEKWELFKTYCIRDVDVEADIRQRLSGFYIPEAERLAWQQDQHINDLGVRVDRVLMHRAQELSDQYTARLIDEARKITGLDNPNSAPQLKKWLEEREGIQVPSLNKETMPGLVEQVQSSDARRMLTIRSELAKTSVSKFEAMERGLCRDGRVHNLLQFYGANRTGRWCLTGDHEVLTLNGWVSLEQWQGGEIVCWNPQSEAFSFQWANDLCFDYEGEMIQLSTQRCEQCSTPDHRMPYLEKDGSWEAKTVEELSQHRFTIPFTGKRVGMESSAPYQLRVLIMTQADGHFTHEGDLRFHFRKKRKVERCKYLLRKCGVPFWVSEHNDSTVTISVKSRCLPLWLRQFRSKTFGYWLLDESPDIIFDELPLWDGYCCGPNSIQYSTTNRQNADVIQAAAILSGRSATLVTKERTGAKWKTAYAVNIWNQPGRGNTVRIEQVSRVPHCGKVYCAETPTGFFLVRRNGKAWVTGNSGRLVQVQNLPQNKLKDLALARELVRNGEFDILEMAFGAPPFVLSQLIRTAFIPSEGCRFIVADYSAIEARVIAWLANENWVLDEFRGDGLIYEATASQMFHIPKLEIKKGGSHADLRPKGKVATLACGYQGGTDALIRMGALKSGIPESDLPGIVKRWRQANPHIVRFWRTVEDAAIRAVKGERITLSHGLKFFCERGWLFIQLPSGRRLAYFQPRIEPDPKFNKEGVTYMGMGQEKNKSWSRQKTYGGKLTENIVQATARDCLRDAMRALWEAGYEIVFHVHDECIIDAPIGFGSLEEVQAIMGQSPSWAVGLPLRADGDEMDFYMKT